MKMKHKALSVCILLVFLFTAVLSVSAAEPDYSRRGSVSVTLTEQSTHRPVAGAEVSLYHIGTVGVNSDGNLTYRYTDTFRDCGISLEDTSLAEKLDAFVGQNSISAAKQTTDSSGKAVFSDLPLGLYLVRQTTAVQGYSVCTPFIVTLPMDNGSGYDYHIDAAPKTTVQQLTDILVKKVWNTDETAKAPDSVTVQLLLNGSVVKTAELNHANNWQMRFENMPQSDGYSVVEINIPKGFTATYSRNGYEFTVINSASLIDTGMLVWPVPVLIMSGLFLIAAGLIILVKAGKTYG